ncbi:MAG: hypothetical protein J1E34_09445 [Oscillospiraceae bacterium]|nr:hypothetical protein [Oscillospiraceae bacterium]
MIRPILACIDPYKTADEFAALGWKIDFSQPPDSGDPLVGVSLFGNSILLGITDGYVLDGQIQYIGCGVEIYITVPAEEIQQIYDNHLLQSPTKLTLQPWGDTAFEVKIGGYKFMIAAEKRFE